MTAQPGTPTDCLLHQALRQGLREHLPGRPGRVYGTRELVLHKHYVAVYRVQGDEVHMLTLFHTAQRR